MFELIARTVERRSWVFVVGWIVFAAVLFMFAPRWDEVSRDDDVSFFPPGSPTVIGHELLQRGFPNEVASSQVVVIAERRDGKLTPKDFNYIDRLTEVLSKLVESEPGLGIKQVLDHRALVLGPRLVGTSADGKGQATLIVAMLRGTYLAKQSRLAVERITKEVEGFGKPPEGLTLGITGSAAVGRDMNTASAESASNTTTATICLVVAILLIVYRSPLLALIPLLTIALSVVTALKGIAWLTKLTFLHFQVIGITNIFVVVVLFGAGTDYCLFLIARYREELARGRNQVAALREAIVQVGGALVASAGTVILGLGMLWFSSFAKIKYTGPAIALSLVIGLIASLTLAPVLLRWLRGAVFFPFKPPHHVTGADVEEEMLQQSPMAGFWQRVANFVIERPGRILAVSILALLPFAYIGSRTRENYSQLSDLHPSSPSIIGATMVQRYFPAGELAPATVLIEHPRLDFRSDEGRTASERLSQTLAALPSIAEVRSISRPLGKAPAQNPSLRERALELTSRPLTYQRYVCVTKDSPDAGHITRIDVVFKSDPFSESSMSALDRVSREVKAAMAPGGPLEGATEFGLAGSTAMVDDLRDVTGRDQHRMYILVTVGVYLILLFLIRRPLLCLYLIATVVLGYLASLGITELVFKALHQGPEPWVGLDWKVGFFLFVILVAIGEDYNIFLISRVLEEEKKHGPIEGTRLAVAHTGGIISSCGLIMAGTFGSMLTGSLTALRELGFALGLGVLLDTFIVRPILVPAFFVLIHRRLEQRSQRVEASALAVEGEPTGSTP
jgi:RND superfamily putative drug exporter